jgi:hypothetical protein
MPIVYNMPPPSEPTFIDLINRASGSANQIAQSIAATSGISQNEHLYNLVLQKNKKNRHLKDSLKQNYSGKIYLTDHIFHAVRHKPKNSEIEFFNMQTAPQAFENSVVIVSNNNVMVDNNLDKFINLYLNSPTSVFVVWDFDNHHWFALSGMLASIADLYVPTHSDNLEPLSRYNNIMAGPVSSGVIQWPKEFLEENKDVITKTERSNDPLGTHIEYPQFLLRMKNLKILHRTLPSVKLVDGSYHGREMLDRFTEWCSHKSHWIVPVLNDAPIRIYDALITGGIPIVPRSLKYHKDVVDLWDHIVFYDYEDIQSPWEITNKANKLFDSRGEQGVLDRHRLICYNHHVDNRVETILKAIDDEYGIST